MSDRLIVMDNIPVLRPVGVRETWRQFFDKHVLNVTGTEATHRCKDRHLCALSKADIIGSVQGDQSIWGTNSTKKNVIFYLLTQITPLTRLI